MSRADDSSVESPPHAAADVGDRTELAELTRRVRDAGLLERQPSFYAVTMLATLSLLCGSLAWLVAVDAFWLQLPNAVFLAFVLGQVALVGHDAGHRQIFRRASSHRLLGVVTTFLVGGSYTWWVDAHDRHHAWPNQHGRDPATDFAFLAVTVEQAARTRGLARLVVANQAFLLLPLMSLYGLSMRIDSARFLMRDRSFRPRAEVVALVLHHAAWATVLVAALGAWQALVFVVVNQLAFGLYVASIFLPNHHGMPVLPADCAVDFLRHQVLTARNVRAARVVSFWYGGLNYQIEHHLFPNAPRSRLRAIRPFVRDFCRERAIAYHETSLLQAFREALSELHRVGRHGRRPARRLRSSTGVDSSA
jgi:fatty acid desaturase